MAREHTDREYEQQLKSLRDQLHRMGAMVEEMIAHGVRALLERDSDRARRTIEADHQVNRLEVETDELCLRILARRQPVASDLRFITIALKLVTDLERIGDLAVNICERVLELNAEPPSPPYPDLSKMAGEARQMVREALDAFMASDAERAQRVIERDRLVDAYYAQLFRQLLTDMAHDPRAVYRATRIQSLAKYLERIGDHAQNLAEMVVFMVKGKDIRHLGRLEEPEGKHFPHGVLFICVGNSARSQMAEGFARRLFPPGIRVWSAGSRPAEGLSPRAVQVMREAGIDITGQRPKAVAEVPLGDVDTVITLCSEEVSLPLPGELRRERWELSDPGSTPGGEEIVLQAFRETRDAIRDRISAFLAELERPRR
ncbi:MAG: phosphate signaling complex protein PhoU [Myxococcales bacterium]|nr:phosphate signaling complex protein PhoU [Myxococcales bacterium]